MKFKIKELKTSAEKKGLAQISFAGKSIIFFNIFTDTQDGIHFKYTMLNNTENKFQNVDILYNNLQCFGTPVKNLLYGRPERNNLARN
jgi:hypothetical protein